MNEFLEQFLVECRELVAQATDDLLALEDRPADRERLDSAFRAFHTLKGAAGIVDFTAMGVALHAGESVLSAVRAGERAIDQALISDCLTCVDQVVQWLDEMEATEELPTGADRVAEAIAERFGAAQDVPAPTVPSPTEIRPADLSSLASGLLTAQAELLDAPAAEGSLGRAHSAGRVAVNVLRCLGRPEDADRLDRLFAEPVGGADAVRLANAIRALQLGEAGLRAEPGTRETAEASARGLRVEVERIDALVALAGELTVAKNALGYAAAMAQDGGDPVELARLLRDQHAVLDRLVARLQRSVLNVRVLPLRQVFQRFPRLVREMVVQLGKPARLVTEGEGTEADKAVVEALFEPLLHVIRNALDHGVEPPAQRAAAGKPPSATITLRAAREGDRVVVEVEDDGGGIDLARVRQVALARGILSAEDLQALPDVAVLDLIFGAGFSTAADVSSLSGRGVGMDAVRAAVERLGGRVTLDTSPGQGTTVRFVVPFTVMMSQVMTVQAGGQTFGVPLDAVVETARLPRDRIVAVGAARAFVLRDRTVPLVPLAEALGVGEAADAGADAHVVVVASGGEIVGLEVERLGERIEVMLKPLDGLLAGAPGVAGATLLGDGGVLIVLDLQELLV